MAGRPRKTGLSYRSSSTYKYEDFKMIDLLDRYGPLGTTIYDVIADMVLRQGYYLEIPMNSLALSVQKTIGSKWIKNRNLVLQVVQYCADIGLFDKDLSLQSVITSVELQRIYALATVRNKVQIEKYRLIEKESDKPLLNAPKKGISDTKNGINVTEIQNTDAKMQGKVKEGDNIYITFSPEVENAFKMYIIVRQYNYGIILPEQIQALREELQRLSADEEEQLAIVKKATAGGWKNFYKVKKEPVKEQGTVQKKKANNFKGRDYDMDKLEKQLLGK